MLDDPDVDAHAKIKIATDMLDRAGLNATEKHLVGVGEVDAVEALFARILNDPNGLAPATSVQYAPSPEFAALNAAADPQEALEDDIVEGEVVEDESSTESMTTKPPPHIRRDLERLGLLC